MDEERGRRRRINTEEVEEELERSHSSGVKWRRKWIRKELWRVRRMMEEEEE